MNTHFFSLPSARQALSGAALAMATSTALAGVSFLGVIDTIPYNPAREIVVSTASAPGVTEHFGAVQLPNVYVGMDLAGGTGYGSLRDGILRGKVASVQGYSMSTDITLTDRLHIVGSTAPTISFDLSAYLNGAPNAVDFSVGAGLVFTARDTVSGALLAQHFFNIQDRNCELFANQPDRTCQSAPVPGIYTMAGTFALPLTASGLLDIAISLDVGALNYATADAGNSAYLRLNVPSGVSVTSASGAFLSNVTTAVPEPASWALTLAGLLVMGRAVRRRGIERHASLQHQHRENPCTTA